MAENTVTTGVTINGVELKALKVVQLRSHLERRCQVTTGKKDLLKSRLERVCLQERLLQVSS